MKHIEDIEALIRTLHKSAIFHALVIQSPPGWAKSTTVEKILKESGIEFESIGSYTTPLQLFSAMGNHPNKTLIIDDCALFGNSIALAVLKAATWESAGSQKARTIVWRSSSERVPFNQVTFEGKLILLTNAIPSSPDVAAFLSRTLHLELRFEPKEIFEMLFEAAKMTEFYPDTNLAYQVVRFLSENLELLDPNKVNLRTLQMGYELIQSNPSSWKQLMIRLLPRSDRNQIIGQIISGSNSPEQQAREFTRLTGLSRRTFFNYRKAFAMHPNLSVSNSPSCGEESPGGFDERTSNAHESPGGSVSSAPGKSHREPSGDL